MEAPDELSSIPDMALRWTSAKSKYAALDAWRSAMMQQFPESRCIRVLWELEHLFNTEKGYAYPSDALLSKATGLNLTKLQSTLTKLDRGGAIIRWHFTINGKRQRRIYASGQLIPSKKGGAHTPQQVRGHNTKAPRVPRTQLQLASLQARQREERERDDATS